MRTAGPFSRIVSSLLAAALVLTTPGLPFYRAAAEVIPVAQPRPAAAGVPAAVVAAGASGLVPAGGAVPLGANPLSHRSLIGDFPRGSDPGVRLRRAPLSFPGEAAPPSETLAGRDESSLDPSVVPAAAPRAYASPAAQLGVRELHVPVAAVGAAGNDVLQASLGRRHVLVARRVDQLARFFAVPSAGEPAWGASPARWDGLSGPSPFILQARKLYPESMGPVPPAAGPPEADGSASSGSGVRSAFRAALFFVVGQIVGQVGIEAWGTYFAKWVQVSYGIGEYSMLTLVSMLGTLGAGYVGGVLIDRLGLKPTYLTALAVGAVAAAAALVMSKLGILPFALLVLFSAGRDFLVGVGRTAEQTIPVAIYPDQPKKLERLNAVAEFALNAVGIVVPFFIGSLLGWFGPLGTMGLLPITAAATILIYSMLMPVQDAPKGAKWEAGPAPEPALLKIGQRAYPAFVMVYFLFFQILAITYGNYLHPGTTPAEQEAAAVVAGKLMSLYSVGGMLAAAALSGMLERAWGWLKRTLGPRAAAAPPETAPSLLETLRETHESTSRWMRLGALGLLSFVPLLWTNLALSSAAMVVFGLTNMMGILKLLALIQENAPPERKGKAMGIARTWAVFGATAGLFGFGQLAKAFPASPFPFAVLLGVLAVVAAYTLWVARDLARYLRKPKP